MIKAGKQFTASFAAVIVPRDNRQIVIAHS